MKSFSLLVLAITSFILLNAQGTGCPQVDAGSDQTIPCSATSATLNASAFNVGETTTYGVTSIPHAPPIAYNAGGGTGVSVNTDDVWSGVINLPFPFCFFGQTYTSCIVGSNGAISFNTSAAGGYHPWPFSASVPSSALSQAGNIFGVYHDIDPSVAGSVRYYILGQAPCRTFIVSYNNLAHYDCTNLRSTHMMVLYETTNVIQVFVNNKSTCGGWNSGNTLIGIQNPAGTVGYTPPGRNTGSWSVNTPEAWQFTPTGAPIYSTIEWFQGVTPVGTGATVTVNPTGPSTTYTARTTYTRCDGLQIPVEDDVVVNYDGVTVDVTPSNAFACSGSITTLTASSPTATSYSWSPGGLTGAVVDVSPTSTTTYTVTATNAANGCTATASATVSIAQPSSTACNVLYVSPSGSPSGDGTRSNPYDLETALEEGACNGTIVKMAVGDYITDSVITKVTSYITLEGGFDPTLNWDKLSTAGATRILRTATQTTSLVSGSGIDDETGPNPEVVAITINNQDGFRFQDLTIETSDLGGGSTYAGYQGVDVIGVRMNNCSAYNFVRTQVIPGSASNGADQIWSIPATNGGNAFGLQVTANGANTNVINSFVQAGAAGLGGAGGGANGTAQNVSLTGTPLVSNDIAFNLTIQPTIQMEDIACTATDIDFTGPSSNNWSFDVGSTPLNATGTNVFTQYSNLGRKNIVYGANTYTGFANIILDDQVNPAISTNAPFINGAYRICAGEAVNFLASNGGIGYIYNWDLGGGATPNTYTGTTYETLSNIVFNTPGIYDITLSYETSCCGVSSSDTLTLVVEEQPIALMPNDTAFCAGILGGVSLNVGGGTTGGSIMWSPSTGLNSTNTYSVVALPNTTTTYSVNLMDSSGICMDTGSVVVTVNDLILDTAVTAASCASNGSATVVVTGGSGSYTYLWSTGGNTQTISVTQPGLVDVVVTDQVSGCADSISMVVPAGPGALVGSVSTTDVACSGDSSGVVIVNVSGGNPPYTYNWQPLGVSNTTNATSDTLMGLAVGSYTIDVSDAGNCQYNASFTIDQPNPLVFGVDTVANPSCSETSDGFIEVRVDGGVRPYTYSWSGGIAVNVVNDVVIATGLANGSYTLTVTDSVGCSDSILFSLNTTPIVATFDTTLCFGESIVINGNTYDSTVIGALEVIPNAGPNSCDSTLTVNVTVLDLLVELIDTTICQGQSILVNGVSYNATGVYGDTLSYSLFACDSVQYLIDLQVDSFIVETIDTTICQGESITVNGTAYTNAGLYADTAFYAVSGCDSVQYVIDLSVDSVVVENIDTTICQGESITVNGTSYNATGLYFDTIPSANSSCDSIQYLINLQVDSFTIETIDTTLCQGETLVVNGVAYSSSGTYQDTAYYAASGCDSMQYFINIQVDSFVVESIDTAICQGESLVVNGVSYSASGLYNDTAFYMASGCDSIQYVINLRVDTYFVENVDTVLCQGESFAFNGVNYTSTGLYYDTLRYTGSGCDSVQYIIDVQIDSFIVENIDTTICQGESITVNGVAYSNSGTYLDTAFYALSGCDSIQYIIDLEVNDVIVENIDTTICQGQSVTVNGITYNTTGVYNDTLLYAQSGCDSVQYVIDVQVDGLSVENIDTAICQGESITVNGTTYSATGVYNDTLRYAQSGCDSVQYVIDLLVSPLPLVEANSLDPDSAACENETLSLFGSGTAGVIYTWDNGVVDNVPFTLPVGQSQYIVTGTDALGCTNADTITMTGYPIYSSSVNAVICEDENYTLPDGTIVNAAGTYTSTFVAANGCDSIITTNLDVNLLGSFQALEDIVVCDGLSQTINIQASNMVSYEWFVNEGLGDQTLVGNPDYLGSNTNELSFNLDTNLHENIYSVVMIDECGNSFTESVELEVYTPRPVANPVSDTTFCLHEDIVLNVDYNGFDYQWNDGTIGPVISPEVGGDYVVTFTENYTNCLMSDTINVSIEDCIGNCVVLAPTAFSPNSSGINDIFRVITTCDEGFDFFEFTIYNRWGELIYITSDWRSGWDGNYKGRTAEIGTYTYTVRYTKTLSNKEEMLKGNVTLIR